jgi:hypothetical protein
VKMDVFCCVVGPAGGETVFPDSKVKPTEEEAAKFSGELCPRLLPEHSTASQSTLTSWQSHSPQPRTYLLDLRSWAWIRALCDMESAKSDLADRAHAACSLTRNKSGRLLGRTQSCLLVLSHKWLLACIIMQGVACLLLLRCRVWAPWHCCEAAQGFSAVVLVAVP